MRRPTFRFAPSPNGRLHLGHAYSAMLNADSARLLSGDFLLRIEDIDTIRCKPEFEAAIYDDLEWLGLAWQKPVRRQSDYFEEYRAVIDSLFKEELIYPSFMSRGDIREFIANAETGGRHWPRDPDGVPLYPGVERGWSKRARRKRIDSGDAFAWRIDVAAALARVGGGLAWREAQAGDFDHPSTIEAKPEMWGDVILARKETPTSYHLSVVVDDALQEITHIVRGMDLYAATSVQRLLQSLLGLPEPIYHHHRLIVGADERKLSKSRGAPTLQSLRNEGHTPSEIREMVDLPGPGMVQPPATLARASK